MTSAVLTAERIRIDRGRRSGQLVIVSIDSTRRGPALGGCRIKHYGSWQDGLADAVRLSAAMTEKAALAELPYGGGKTVVPLVGAASVAAASGAARADLMADIGDAVEQFGGEYLTGPDIGTGPPDMAEIHRRTEYALCRPVEAGGSGDSSGPTATGVVCSIAAVGDHLFAEGGLGGRRAAVIGLGHVGARVARWLAEQGAHLTVADLDPSRRQLAEQLGATWTTPDDALFADVDLVVPCATGGLLTVDTVARLRCAAVVGAANNQLDDDATAELLHRRGIVWIPDTMASAGGIVAAVAKERERVNDADADQRVRTIGQRVRQLLLDAEAKSVSPLRAARDVAAARLR